MKKIDTASLNLKNNTGKSQEKNFYRFQEKISNYPRKTVISINRGFVILSAKIKLSVTRTNSTGTVRYRTGIPMPFLNG
jgi:hypothetical protein